MNNVSTGRKLGIAARVAVKQIKGSRTYGALLGGIRATLGHFWAVARQLWLQMAGFVFLVFAAAGLLQWVKEYIAYRAGGASPNHMAVAAGFTLVFGWFGVTSFWRARRPRKKS